MKDEPDTPKLWRDMTPEEKGALLLAHHEGKVIQCFGVDLWHDEEWPFWHPEAAYRIRPEQSVEPKRETVEIRGHVGLGWSSLDFDDDDTHRITFDLIDGKPDPASIKLEAL